MTKQDSLDNVRIETQAEPKHDVCADETFTSAFANSRKGHLLPKTWRERVLRPYGVQAAVGEYMAGMPCPTAERLTDLVHDISEIAEWEKRAVNELFAQLSPPECHEFMLTTDGSPREVARLMRECGVRRAVVVNWINQYSDDWKDDTMLSILFGERTLRNQNNLKRHR